ncbi:MAG TPA: S-layer homology domain-containing protein [Symbiobacteriaceae bacterium]|nr:S-layer homology domain-containing protein [Symbiobacteriaceae bacterium]
MTTRKLAASAVAAALLASVATTALAAETVPGAVYSDSQAAGANKPAPKVKEDLEKAGIKDVAPEHYAAGSITVLVESGLLKPDAEGKLEPEASLNTGDGVAIFAKVLGIASKEDSTDAALTKAKEAGLLTPTASAESDLPRVEVARMLAKALGAQPKTITSAADYPFADYESTSPEDRGILAALYELGIFKGFEDKTFRPDAILTKAQIAILIDRILGAGK